MRETHMKTAASKFCEYERRKEQDVTQAAVADVDWPPQQSQGDP
jgi:hypothetical protein